MKDYNLLIQNGVDLKKSLELFGDMAMYDESLGDFLAEINNKQKKISQYKESNDMENYAIYTHSLKTDAMYFGFVKLAELAFIHERESKSNNILFVNNNYDLLLNETNRIISLINQYFNNANHEKEQVVNNTITNNNLPSILVVDDSDIIKNYIKKIFEKEYKVLSASDGNEAIKIMSDNHLYNIKATLLDLNMPNADGFKVLNYMKEYELFDKLPVSIVTGNDNKDVDDAAFLYPIKDILKKPFSEKTIRDFLQKTISQ